MVQYSKKCECFTLVSVPNLHAPSQVGFLCKMCTYMHTIANCPSVHDHKKSDNLKKMIKGVTKVNEL